MLRLISALLGLVLLLVMGLAAGLLLVRDASPGLRPMPELSAEQQRWGKELMHERLLANVGASGEPIEISPAELDVLAALLAEQMRDSRLRVRLGEGSADLQAAVRLPTQLGGWLNLTAVLVAPDGALAFDRVELGGLPVPSAVAELLLSQTLAALNLPALPTGIDFSPEALRIQPDGQAGRSGHPLAGLMSSDEEARLLAAQRRLAGLSLLRTEQRWIDAADLLSALIGSTPADAADPAAENRASILALAGYVNGRSLPDPTAAPAPRLIPVRMRGRKDIPQHFFTSGALLLQGGSGLANLIGLAKEFDDADSGSGFSFSDLAANQAGNRFAELATADARSARRIQQLARSGLSEADIMPAVDWLPETMPLATFERDFGGRDSQAYRIVVDEIGRRIEALPVVRAVKDSS